jgi:hypothetical protein
MDTRRRWLADLKGGIGLYMTRLQSMLQESRGLLYRSLSVGLVVASAGCVSNYSRENRMPAYRSPSYDYQQQQRIAGGDVLGADGRQMSDKLAEGPTQQGFAPGWKLRRKDGLTYDPNQRVGGNIDPPRRAEQSAPTAPP